MLKHMVKGRGERFAIKLSQVKKQKTQDNDIVKWLILNSWSLNTSS